MIRHFTYLDIPTAVRAQTASQALRRTQEILADPLSTDEQRLAAKARQEHMRGWVKGTLPLVPFPEPQSQPQNHTVEVVDEIWVKED